MNSKVIVAAGLAMVLAIGVAAGADEKAAAPAAPEIKHRPRAR